MMEKKKQGLSFECIIFYAFFLDFGKFKDLDCLCNRWAVGHHLFPLVDRAVRLSKDVIEMNRVSLIRTVISFKNNVSV